MTFFDLKTNASNVAFDPEMQEIITFAMQTLLPLSQKLQPTLYWYSTFERESSQYILQNGTSGIF